MSECRLLKLTIDSLRLGLPRAIRTGEDRRPIRIFTDGATASETDFNAVGAVFPCAMEELPLVPSASVPECLVKVWLRRSKSTIAEVELLAIVWIKILMASRICGNRVVYYIANEGAWMNLIRSSNNSQSCAELLRFFFVEKLGLPSLSWYARVPSKSNSTDAPWRLLVDEFREYIGQFSLLEAEAPNQLLALGAQSAS
eukprot:1029680-Amphidinium_carterae.1